MLAKHVDREDVSSVADLIMNATPPPSSTAKIHKVPKMAKKNKDEYTKYYVPKVVSIGPYHFGNPDLELAEKLKPYFAKMLLPDKKKIEALYGKLGEPNMVQELRGFYKENSTEKFCDKVFSKMMLFDGCFILHYIQHIFQEKDEKCQELNSHQISYVHQDLFLLENQIPSKVLHEVMMQIPSQTQICPKKIRGFIDDNILSIDRSPKRPSFESKFWAPKPQSRKDESKFEFDKFNHLLHLLHDNLTKNENDPNDHSHPSGNRCTFRNVSELEDVWIRFRPSGTKGLSQVNFLESNWWFLPATVELPPISLDDSTKPILLNLIAYEMCSDNAHDSWVTSYICLLDSLIDHPEDVKTLRKSGVLENSLGSDQEVAKLFNEIGTDLVPSSSAYVKAREEIQKHYEDKKNKLTSQLKHEYVKSPWAFIALLGALLALFLSGVQTYYTVWSPKGECDDLCMLLQKNHHL